MAAAADSSALQEKLLQEVLTVKSEMASLRALLNETLTSLQKNQSEFTQQQNNKPTKDPATILSELSGGKLSLSKMLEDIERSKRAKEQPSVVAAAAAAKNDADSLLLQSRVVSFQETIDMNKSGFLNPNSFTVDLSFLSKGLRCPACKNAAPVFSNEEMMLHLASDEHNTVSVLLTLYEDAKRCPFCKWWCAKSDFASWRAHVKSPEHAAAVEAAAPRSRCNKNNCTGGGGGGPRAAASADAKPTGAAAPKRSGLWKGDRRGV